MSRKEHWEKAYSTKGENEVSWFARGFKNVTVLDLSEAALAVVKAGLADRAKCVQWIAADVSRCTQARLTTFGTTVRLFIFSRNKPSELPM